MYPTTRTALLVTRDRMNDEHRRADNDRRWRAPANETKTETGAAPAPVPLGTIRRLIGRGRAIHVWG